jgi:hypothetical protein
MAEQFAGVYGSAGHFATDPNFEVQRTNHFEVVLDLARLNLAVSDATEHLRLSTKSFTQPKVSSEAIELRHGNDIVKVAKSPSFDNLTLTVQDTLGRDQLHVVQSWFEKVFDRKTKLMGRVSAYKTDGILYMYSPDGAIVRKWILQGVWPLNYGQGNEFSFDNNGDAQTISMELSVDRYWEEGPED